MDLEKAVVTEQGQFEWEVKSTLIAPFRNFGDYEIFDARIKKRSLFELFCASEENARDIQFKHIKAVVF